MIKMNFIDRVYVCPYCRKLPKYQQSENHHTVFCIHCDAAYSRKTLDGAIQAWNEYCTEVYDEDEEDEVYDNDYDE